MPSEPPFPEIVPLGTIRKALPDIFPEGIQHRAYVVREIAAKTIFTMIYAGAVQGWGNWLRPDQVTKMTDRQAAKVAPNQRARWSQDSLSPGKMTNVPSRWYAPNTRESIRDETLRNGLIPLGAVDERSGLPTTSAQPRYALAADFYDLLIQCTAASANKFIAEWQTRHLSAAALSRITLTRRGAVRTSDRIKVTFPSGETRLMNPGPSTIISKAVIEEFASRFLREPAVVFLSESREKIVARDVDLAHSLGLDLNIQRDLADILLADVVTIAPKLVFVEVVATDGAITEQRKKALLKVAANAGFESNSVYFVTAFLAREAAPFRNLCRRLRGVHSSGSQPNRSNC